MFFGILQQKLENLDQVHDHGEYKLWIYQRYRVPSFHFVMAVDPIPSFHFVMAVDPIPEVSCALLPLCHGSRSYPEVSCGIHFVMAVDPIPEVSCALLPLCHGSGSCTRGIVCPPSTLSWQWILYQRYRVPSFHFVMAVDPIPPSRYRVALLPLCHGSGSYTRGIVCPPSTLSWQWILYQRYRVVSFHFVMAVDPEVPEVSCALLPLCHGSGSYTRGIVCALLPLCHGSGSYTRGIVWPSFHFVMAVDPIPEVSCGLLPLCHGSGSYTRGIVWSPSTLSWQWILYQRYRVPSFHFVMAVDPIPEVSCALLPLCHGSGSYTRGIVWSLLPLCHGSGSYTRGIVCPPSTLSWQWILYQRYRVVQSFHFVMAVDPIPEVSCALLPLCHGSGSYTRGIVCPPSTLSWQWILYQRYRVASFHFVMAVDPIPEVSCALLPLCHGSGSYTRGIVWPPSTLSWQWILYQRYRVPSFHFVMAVDPIPEVSCALLPLCHGSGSCTRGIVWSPSTLSWQWILYQRYRVPSFHFVMAVDPIPEVSCGLLPLCHGSGSYTRGIVCPPSTLSWQWILYQRYRVPSFHFVMAVDPIPEVSCGLLPLCHGSGSYTRGIVWSPSTLSWQWILYQRYRVVSFHFVMAVDPIPEVSCALLPLCHGSGSYTRGIVWSPSTLSWQWILYQRYRVPSFHFVMAVDPIPEVSCALLPLCHDSGSYTSIVWSPSTLSWQWILYQRYRVPSFHFVMAVDPIPEVSCALLPLCHGSGSYTRGIVCPPSTLSWQWILYQRYRVPSFHFVMAVDPIPEVSCGPPSTLSWQWILYQRYRVVSFHFVMAVDPIPEVSCALLPLCHGSGSYTRGIVCPPSTLSWQWILYQRYPLLPLCHGSRSYTSIVCPPSTLSWQWILYQRYRVPSFHFVMAVDPIPEVSCALLPLCHGSGSYTRGIVCPPSTLSWQWILYQRYRVPSFHFVMAVDPIPEVSCALLPLCHGSGSYTRGIVCPPSTLS